MKKVVKQTMKKILLMGIFSILLMSCKKENEGTVAIKVTDDPFPMSFVSEANVKYAKVEFKNDKGEYITVYEGNTNINMVNYTNGATTEVGVKKLPKGTYTEARVSISDVNVRLSDNRTFHHDFGGSHSHVVSVAIDPVLEIKAGDNHDVLLDLDLSHSFTFGGLPFGGWFNNVSQIIGISNFHADFRCVDLDQTGDISGTVKDGNGNAIAGAYVYVEYDYDHDGTAEEVSTICESNGTYTIKGLPVGTYTVKVHAHGHPHASTGNVSVTHHHNSHCNFSIGN